MTRSVERIRRLKVAKTLPAKRCPYCDTALTRVLFPDQHVARCNARLKTVKP